MATDCQSAAPNFSINDGIDGESVWHWHSEGERGWL